MNRFSRPIFAVAAAGSGSVAFYQTASQRRRSQAADKDGKIQENIQTQEQRMQFNRPQASESLVKQVSRGR
jgi:hypothetical protein